MGVINQLPPSVVNRIAAGEVVVRPANAVKELLENSLDAGATEIVVTLKQGGLELLRVQDNGRGFLKDDLPMACVRFATSKLHEFDDLHSMQTFGFRGEALASISLVSKVSITSRRADEPCAWTASYAGCQMTALKASAGSSGTAIVAEEMFHDAPARRAALKGSEEAARVEDIVTRYAVNRPDVSFAFRGGASSYRTRGDGNRRTVISQLIGPDVAENMLPLSHSSSELNYSLSGCLSEPISTATAGVELARKSRRKALFLFINGRPVTCQPIRLAVDSLFSDRDLICQFVHLSLEIEPMRVDVNAHPTKEEVIFLEEEAIVEDIGQYISQLLPSTTDQQLTQGTVSMESLGVRLIPVTGSPKTPKDTPLRTQPPAKEQKQQQLQYEFSQVRTDPSERRLHAFTHTSLTDMTDSCLSVSFTSPQVEMVPVRSSSSSASSEEEGEEAARRVASQEDSHLVRDLQLQSVDNLIRQICGGTSQSLRELFKEHTFVGCIDAERVLVQHGTGLYALKMRPVMEEFFYQTVIFGFGNLGCFRLEEPIPIAELYAASFDDPIDHQSIQQAVDLLSERADMLYDYLSLSIESVQEELCLLTIPSLMTGFLPQLEGLPQLVRELVEAPWEEDEETCLSRLCRSVARLFTIKSDFCEGPAVSGLPDSAEWEPLLRDHILPRIRLRLLPQESFKEEGVVYRVVEQRDMYNVFERC